MNPDPGSDRIQGLLDGGLAFYGALTASVSHELNNVVSIIDQTAGLLGDMLAGEQHGIPITNEKLVNIVSAIQKQTGRGLQIIQRLNRFAHSADHPVTEFDMNEVINNLVDLTRRLADLKRAQLEFKPYAMTAKVTGNPFLLQQVVFGAIKLCLSSVERDDTIEITVQSVDNKTSVVIMCTRDIIISDEARADLMHVTDYLSGKLMVEEVNGRTEFCVTVPKRPPVVD